MKKSLMLITMMMVSAIIFAQSPVKNPGQRAAEQSEEMKAALSLTETQYAAIKDINKKYAEKHIELKKDSSDRNEKHAAMKSLKQEKDSEIEAILTPEQKTKWAAYREEHAERRKDRVEETMKRNETQMKSTLSLSDDQFAKMQAVNKDFREKIMALRSQSQDSRMADKTEFKKIRDEHEAAIKNILTEEQFKKWLDLKKERRGAHHHGDK